MESKSRQLPVPPRAGLPPLKGLHSNGSASVAELKEFLGTLKGRNPQEVIGMVSASLLIQSLGIAAIATVLLLGVFTVGPYLAYGPPKQKKLATTPAAAAKAKSDAAASQPADASPASTELDAKAVSPDAAKAAQALGIDEVKDSDPSKNPLDKGPNIDNLLDGLD